MRPPRARLRFVLSFGCAVGLVCGSTPHLNAQQVQLRHHARFELPTRVSIQHGMLDVRQRVGMSLGSRLTITFNKRFALISGVTYIPGYATIRAAGKRIEVGTGAHLLSTTIGARYWLVPPERMLSWEVQTVVGLIAGGQRAYQDLFDGSTLSGAVATTVRYQIGQIVRLQLRVQERLYRAHFGAGDPGNSNPLRISFGLIFPFLDLAQNTQPQSTAAVESHP
jgi:hypothetical protein